MSSTFPRTGSRKCGAGSKRDGSFKTPSAKCWRPTPSCSCWSARNLRKRKNEPFDATSSAPLCDTASSPPTVSPGSWRRSATTADSGAGSARALLIGQILRESSFHAVEALVRSSARRTLSIATPFCDDTLGYFTERLDPGPTRQALLSLIRGAKRNKAFDDCRWIGLALDGTGAGWRTQQGCTLCRPSRTLRNRSWAINILS